MDGSRVVKIFELDAAQDFVGLDWTGSAMALTRGGDDKKKKTAKKGATSAHGKRPKTAARAKTSSGSGSSSSNRRRHGTAVITERWYRS